MSSPGDRPAPHQGAARCNSHFQSGRLREDGSRKRYGASEPYHSLRKPPGHLLTGRRSRITARTRERARSQHPPRPPRGRATRTACAASEKIQSYLQGWRRSERRARARHEGASPPPARSRRPPRRRSTRPTPIVRAEQIDARVPLAVLPGKRPRAGENVASRAEVVLSTRQPIAFGCRACRPGLPRHILLDTEDGR